MGEKRERGERNGERAGVGERVLNFDLATLAHFFFFSPLSPRTPAQACGEGRGARGLQKKSRCPASSPARRWVREKGTRPQGGPRKKRRTFFLEKSFRHCSVPPRHQAFPPPHSAFATHSHHPIAKVRSQVGLIREGGRFCGRAGARGLEVFFCRRRADASLARSSRVRLFPQPPALPGP